MDYYLYNNLAIGSIDASSYMIYIAMHGNQFYDNNYPTRNRLAQLTSVTNSMFLITISS